MRWIAGVLFLVVAAAASETVKPKPWMWTPTKVAQRLVAIGYITGNAGRQTITAVSCQGRSRPVAGRYTAFKCEATWPDVNMSSGKGGALVWVKLKQAGTGKICYSQGSFALIDPACLA